MKNNKLDLIVLPQGNEKKMTHLTAFDPKDFGLKTRKKKLRVDKQD